MECDDIMAVFETKFSIGDPGWDLLAKKRRTISGIRIEKYKTSEGFHSLVLYTLAHIEGAFNPSFRKEDELEKAD